MDWESVSQPGAPDQGKAERGVPWLSVFHLGGKYRGWVLPEHMEVSEDSPECTARL